MSSHLPKLGSVWLDDSRTSFTVWAPLHERLELFFPAAARAVHMTPLNDGYHTLTTDAPPGTLYQIQYADGRRRPDPASRAQPDGVHGPSMVIQPAGTNTTPAFQNSTLADHVIYELHVGTFTPEGTFDAIIPRLAALRELGVTAIELMPIGQFPGNRNWGYDGVNLFAAQWSYGALAGLQRLIHACHTQGLAIFLDVVYNHLGPEGNYLAEFGPYFTDKYKTPWGAPLNFDGRDSDHVREFFIQNALHWTRDCGIDGLRVDAVHAIIDHSAVTFIEELAIRVHDAAAAQRRRVLVIAESSDNDPRLIRPRERGGYALDGCWNDDYHHAIRTAITGDRRGYYAPFGDVAQISKAIRDRYVFAGEYSSGHGKRHGAPAPDIAHSALVVFTQNHDQVGNRATGDRLDHSAGLDGARTAAALVLLSPFTPMLWMGEEYAESAPFQYFVSHSDESLIEAVRRGRAAEFAELVGADGVPDPQAIETFNRSKLTWETRTSGDHAAMLIYYTNLLELRASLKLTSRSREVAASTSGSLVSIIYSGSSELVVIANVGTSPTHTALNTLGTLPNSPWAVLLDSSDTRWGGGGSHLPATINSLTPITIAAKSALLLQASKEFS